MKMAIPMLQSCVEDEKIMYMEIWRYSKEISAAIAESILRTRSKDVDFHRLRSLNSLPRKTASEPSHFFQAHTRFTADLFVIAKCWRPTKCSPKEDRLNVVHGILHRGKNK